MRPVRVACLRRASVFRLGVCRFLGRCLGLFAGFGRAEVGGCAAWWECHAVLGAGAACGPCVLGVAAWPRTACWKALGVPVCCSGALRGRRCECWGLWLLLQSGVGLDGLVARLGFGWGLSAWPRTSSDGCRCFYFLRLWSPVCGDLSVCCSVPLRGIVSPSASEFLVALSFVLRCIRSLVRSRSALAVLHKRAWDLEILGRGVGGGWRPLPPAFGRYCVGGARGVVVISWLGVGPFRPGGAQWAHVLQARAHAGPQGPMWAHLAF